jgi:hypothetical protein
MAGRSPWVSPLRECCGKERPGIRNQGKIRGEQLLPRKDREPWGHVPPSTDQDLMDDTGEWNPEWRGDSALPHPYGRVNSGGSGPPPATLPREDIPLLPFFS